MGARAAPVYRINARDNTDALPALTSKQSVALRALVEGKTREEAGLAAGVHRNTVNNWLCRSESFVAHLAFAQRMVFGELFRSLQSEAVASVQYLAKLRDNTRANNNERTRAAVALLKFSQWPVSAATPVVPTKQQQDLLLDAYAACSEESMDDLESYLAVEHMRFDPEARRREIGELMVAVERERKTIAELESTQRSTEAAGRESGREDDQLVVEQARRRLFRAEQDLDRATFEIRQFEGRQNLVLGQFEEGEE